MKRVEVKTDASKKKSVVGMGYVSKIDNEFYTGGSFISGKYTSTEAEMLSTAWAIYNLTNKIDIDPSKHTLVAQTDCENTVNKFERDYESKEMRFIKYYEKLYDEMLMFWIPRQTNQKADSISKTMLRKGEENE